MSHSKMSLFGKEPERDEEPPKTKTSQTAKYHNNPAEQVTSGLSVGLKAEREGRSRQKLSSPPRRS